MQKKIKDKYLWILQRRNDMTKQDQGASSHTTQIFCVPNPQTFTQELSDGKKIDKSNER